jgi:hemerythrin superfamily protein
LLALKEAGMDAIRMIKHDHRKVESLFEQFEALIGLPGDGRTRLIGEICDELELHTKLEEELLYPEARGVLDAEMVDYAREEHRDAEQLIARIRETDGGSPVVESFMVELRRRVAQHIEEEESTFLPQMEQACPTEALDALGARIEQRKEQLESSQRPIEHAASSMGTTSGGDSELLLDLTKEELYEKAQQAEIPGRSKMTKSELAEALSGRT